MQIHEIFLGSQKLDEALQTAVAPIVQKAFQNNPKVSNEQEGQQAARFLIAKGMGRQMYSQWAVIDRQISNSLAGDPAKLENYKTRSDGRYIKSLTGFVMGNMLDGLPPMSIENKNYIDEKIAQISQPDNTDRYEYVQTLFNDLTELCVTAQTDFMLNNLKAQRAQQEAQAKAAAEAERQQKLNATIAIRNKQRAQAAGIQQGA
jgi:hypothetical protein